MKNKKRTRSLKVILSYSIIALCLGISVCWVGVPYYIKYSFEKYTKLHELEIDIELIHFNWRLWEFPTIMLNKVDIKNRGANPTFTRISLKNVLLEPNYRDFFKSYFQDYNLFLKIKSLNVTLISGDILEANNLTSKIRYKDNVYQINDFTLSPFQIKLSKNSLSLNTAKDKADTYVGRLVIYEVKGEGRYYSSQRELDLYLKVPPAATHSPQGKTYALQAKGKIKLLGLMPYQYANNPEDPGIRGTITYTIDNFSNMLHQLREARFISTLAENLGSVIGYPIPRVDPFTEQAEIFTNAVSLDMTFKAEGTYLGPMKL